MKTSAFIGLYTLCIFAAILLLLPSSVSAFRVVNMTPSGSLVGSETCGTYCGTDTIDGSLGGSSMWEEHWPAPGQDGSSPNGNEWGISWDMGSGGWNFTKAYVNIQNPTYCSAPCNVLNAAYGSTSPGIPPSGYTTLSLTGGAIWINNTNLVGSSWYRLSWSPPTGRGRYLYIDGNAMDDGNWCHQLSTSSCTDPYSGMGSGGGGGMTGLWEVIVEVQKYPEFYTFASNTTTIPVSNSIIEFTSNFTNGTEITDKIWINVTSTLYGTSNVNITTANRASGTQKLLWFINGYNPALYTATVYLNSSDGVISSLDAVTVNITGAPDGSVCSNGTGCNSGNCVDGICCGSSSCSLCQSCNVASHLGTCWNDNAGTDQDNACFSTVGVTYGCGTGNCNGLGACGYYTANEYNCPTCYTCTGATSQSCVATNNHQADAEGSNLCSSTCVECNGAGSCVNQSSGSDYFDQCGTSSCGTGTCNGNGACNWYTSLERNCATCGTCDGATSTACVNVANNNWDTQGSNTCTGTCIACESGVCTTTQNQTNPGSACTTTNCGKGVCNAGGVCDWYNSGERNCAQCKTCDGASSTSCMNVATGQWDTQGSNTCTGTCMACDSGSCSIAGVGTNPGSVCNSTDCGTGFCKGGVAQCDWYTYSERNCQTCYTCDGASSTSCVLMSNNTQDTQGSNVCSSTCKKCVAGSCINQSSEDLFSQCGFANCGTGLCQAGNATCDWYSSGERNCATCQTCDGATSTSCISFGNMTQDSQGSLFCDDTCRMCNGLGACSYEAIGSDFFSQCANDVNCNTGSCNGAGNCGYLTTGQGSCPVCQTCNGTSTTDCLDMPAHTQDTEGNNTCTATCKECSGSGLCWNQATNQDYFSQCGTVFCDDEATNPYYYGWILNECRYRSDVDSTNALCSGSGNCYNDTNYCPTQSQSVYTASSCYSGASILDCYNQTVGKCAPFIISFTTNDTNPYISPYGIGLVQLNMNVYKGTYSIENITFTYNGTLGDTIIGTNGTNTMLWNVSTVSPGVYYVIGTVTDTQNNTDEYDHLTITVHNNTAPTNTANILGGGNETTSKFCEVTFSDIDPGQTEAGREYDWKINGTLIGHNSENLSISFFKPGDNITCLVRSNDSYFWGEWTESPLLVIGDTTPPIPYNFEINPTVFHTNEFGMMCFEISDASGLDTSASYIDFSDPINVTSNNLVTYDVLNNKYCYTLLSPSVTGTWWWTDVDIKDSAGNPAFKEVNMSFIVTEPENTTIIIEGGGGGGGPKVDVPIEILPKDVVTGLPEIANLIGNKVKTYTVKPTNTGTFDIKYAFAKTIVTQEGKTVDATSFFKTIPSGAMTLQNGVPQNVSIYCDIPDEYAYAPFGVFNTTLIFAQSTKAIIQVNCESTAHSAGAGVLANILYETIPGIGIKVWEFLSLLILIVFWRSMLVK
jgi:hypothetical protein